MPNILRKSSEYVYQIPASQLSALLALAKSRDQPLENLIWEALDQYIKKEEISCQEQ